MIGDTSDTRASYKLKEYEDGTFSALTNTSWSRTFGRCNCQDFSRQGEIYTQSRLRAWMKKYNLTINETDIEKLPRSL